MPYLFADDTKCLHAAKTNEDFITIQEDLNVACKRSKECSLTFNFNKSAVFHFWYKHETPTKYLLNTMLYEKWGHAVIDDVIHRTKKFMLIWIAIQNSILLWYSYVETLISSFVKCTG